MLQCGTDGQTNDEQLKIELLSQWKLEAEFRNTENSENNENIENNENSERNLKVFLLVDLGAVLLEHRVKVLLLAVPKSIST